MVLPIGLAFDQTTSLVHRVQVLDQRAENVVGALVDHKLC